MSIGKNKIISGDLSCRTRPDGKVLSGIKFNYCSKCRGRVVKPARICNKCKEITALIYETMFKANF
jgi:hypothetical protein